MQELPTRLPPDMSPSSLLGPLSTTMGCIFQAVTQHLFFLMAGTAACRGLPTPMAPELGLFLDESIFASYNER